MSKVIAAKHQIGISATGSQNFGLTTPDVPDGSLSLTRGPAEAPTDTILKVSPDNTIRMITPMFSALRSGADQAVTSNVALKAVFGNELKDNSNTYDPALSRWTPGVAGWYMINGGASLSHAGQSPTSIVSVYKNGAEAKRLAQVVGANGANPRGSTVIYLNATDYVELWVVEAGSAGSILSEVLVGEFSGFFVSL